MPHKIAPFTLDDINVGDRVYFKAEHVPNYDLYWPVIGKTNGHLQLKIDEMGAQDMRFVHPDNVKYCEPREPQD